MWSYLCHFLCCHCFYYICINFYLDVTSFSKFHEPQISDAINLPYSSIDEIIKETIGPVVIQKSHTKKKYKKDQVQKNLNMNNQGNEESAKQTKDKASEHECENEADQNSHIFIQTQGKIAFRCSYIYK